MKGTAMAVVIGGTVASAECTFKVPQVLISKGARLESVSCDVSDTCCHGLHDLVGVAVGQMEGKGTWRPMDGSRAQGDLLGTCGRRDQVDLYNCAATTLPKLVPQGKGGKTRAMIQAKGCPNVVVSAGTDGSGTCTIEVKKGKGKGTMKLHMDGVSTGCCDRIQAMEDSQSCETHEEYGGTMTSCGPSHEGKCGMIGACGKQDQKSIFKEVMAMKGKGKGDGPHASQLELLETFNMTNGGGAQQMMETFMTSEAEDDVMDDVTEDDVTEDGAADSGSQIVTGLLGFVAGATVTGLGVTILRRKTPAQEEYNEIVA